MSRESAAVSAQALIHHAYLQGLQLMASSNLDRAVVGDWMYHLFRRQHEQKFLASFDKLGLGGLPDAVACARYHVLSNQIGGVAVEYYHENDRKAWVRFRYPRWMFAGPTICGVPIEVSRGFLKGWYARNGISLDNPRLGFVCVSEDMSGEFGLCGYFREFDHELTEEERLQFARGELPPAFDPQQQPRPPAAQWNETRLLKAQRNYAVDFVRNAIVALEQVAGTDQARALAGRAARLIGLQYLAETRSLLEVADGDLACAVDYLTCMLQGMGDRVEAIRFHSAHAASFQQHGLRIVRQLDDAQRRLVLACWEQLWAGALASFRDMKTLRWQVSAESIEWQVAEMKAD